jgi:hypothetical protein
VDKTNPPALYRLEVLPATAQREEEKEEKKKAKLVTPFDSPPRSPRAAPPRAFILRRVARNAASLDSEHCFVLDSAPHLFVWNGRAASRAMRLWCKDFVSVLNNQERGGKMQTAELEEGAKEGPEFEAFCAALARDPESPTTCPWSGPKIYRVAADSGGKLSCEVARQVAAIRGADANSGRARGLGNSRKRPLQVRKRVHCRRLERDLPLVRPQEQCPLPEGTFLFHAFWSGFESVGVLELTTRRIQVTEALAQQLLPNEEGRPEWARVRAQADLENSESLYFRVQLAGGLSFQRDISAANQNSAPKVYFLCKKKKKKTTKITHAIMVAQSSTASSDGGLAALTDEALLSLCNASPGEEELRLPEDGLTQARARALSLTPLFCFPAAI